MTASLSLGKPNADLDPRRHAPCPVPALQRGPPSIMSLLPSFLHLERSEWYESIFGDTSISEFYLEHVPLLYVTVMPFLAAFITLFCVFQPGAIVAAPWRPRPTKGSVDFGGAEQRRGRRVVRRAMMAVQTTTRMAQAINSTPLKGRV